MRLSISLFCMIFRLEFRFISHHRKAIFISFKLTIEQDFLINVTIVFVQRIQGKEQELLHIIICRILYHNSLKRFLQCFLWQVAEFEIGYLNCNSERNLGFVSMGKVHQIIHSFSSVQDFSSRYRILICSVCQSIASKNLDDYFITVHHYSNILDSSI